MPRCIDALQERFADEAERKQWYRYLDWLLALPREYDLRVWDEVLARKKETAVPYVTFAERYGMEKGLLTGIEALLDLRYPDAVSALMPLARRVERVDALEQLVQVAKSASLDEIRAAIEAAQPVAK